MIQQNIIFYNDEKSKKSYKLYLVVVNMFRDGHVRYRQQS